MLTQKLKSQLKLKMKLKLKAVIRNIDLVSRIVGQGKMVKLHDVVEKTTTRYFIPAKTLKDFFDNKYSTKKIIIQSIIFAVIWIAPIKWLIELIVYQT